MAKKESSEDKLINLQAQQLAAQVANWAAQLDFAKERFRLLEMPQFETASQLEIDRLAFEKAQDTWQRAFQEASLSGTYNGVPTIEWLTQQAQLTGVLNGQQTLQGKLTDAQIQQMNEQMRLANQQFLVTATGYIDGRPTFEREQWTTGQTGYLDGQATLARQQMEAELSGYFGGQATLEREQFAAEQTQNYLNLLASLQGPGNAFKQLRVLGATPNGLQDLVSAWAGNYNLPGFGSTGAPGQAQISDLWAGMGPTGVPTGGPSYPGQYIPAPGPPSGSFGQPLPESFWGGGPSVTTGSGPAAIAPPVAAIHHEGFPAWADPGRPIGYTPYIPPPVPAYTFSPEGTQAPVGAYNYEATQQGHTQVYPPGVAAPPQDAQVSTQTPVNTSTANSLLANPIPGMGGTTPTLSPSQINAENYANTNPYAQEVMWAWFEDQGWDPQAAKAEFMKSLPQYSGPAMGSFSR